MVTYTDDLGTPETVFSDATSAVMNLIVGTAGCGGLGNDTMAGGLGNDTYEVTELGDVVTELAGEGTDTVWTSLLNYTLSANVEILAHSGSGSFTRTGNALANSIYGGSGNDVLNSGAGNDILIDGLGNGTFMFAAGFGNDMIQGFDANPAGGQHLLNIAAQGVTAATFAASVTIADVGADPLVSVGGGSIRLVGINDATTTPKQTSPWRYKEAASKTERGIRNCGMGRLVAPYRIFISEGAVAATVRLCRSRLAGEALRCDGRRAAVPAAFAAGRGSYRNAARLAFM